MLTNPRISIVLTIVQLVIAMFAESVRAGEPSWQREFEQASQQAKADGKDLFLLFTGHGWCHACDVLDREVFQQPAFNESASRHFVFVEFDLNFDESPEGDERKTNLMKLQSRYLAPGVPTIVLADAQGKPYAYITGYETGAGHTAFLAEMDSARSAKEKRDNYILLSASQSGETKAETLNEALACIAPQLGKISERGDDPLLRFYGDLVDEILDLVEGKGVTADKYLSMRKHRNSWLAGEAIFGKIEQFETRKDYAGAINFIDSILPSQESQERRLRLEFARQYYLECDDKNQDALENCRRLLALTEIGDDLRESLLDREAYNLFQLERIAEGLAHYDRRIENAASDSTKRTRLLRWKSTMVLDRDPVEQSIAVCENYRASTELGSDEWVTATGLLARELRRAHRHMEAIQLSEELIKNRREAWNLLDAAVSNIALKNTDDALRLITEAEGLAEKFKGSERKADRDKYMHLSNRIAALKDEMAAMSRK